ncbi:MAG: SET domain-containing protein [Bdellovibrionaceae bacterium]|nr:SET domain-containing protein [Pseudobdellovibrionaceae bacterium]
MPTYLGPSAIQGLGVFTPQFIPAGTRLWQFDPSVDWRLRGEEVDQMPASCLGQFRRWSYIDEEGMYVFCGDNAKFMNHSEAPNCDDQGGEHTVALRDIQAGEELTCDYRLFDEESKQLGGGLFVNGHLRCAVEAARAAVPGLARSG